MSTRRRFLKTLAASAAASFATAPLLHALGKEGEAHDEFFVFLQAHGGWDILVSTDPRTEKRGSVDPPSTANTTIGGVKQWRSATLAGDVATFAPIASKSLVLGPAIGDLLALADRMTVINGINMSTVDHADGAVFSATGRHLAGARPVASSIDVVLAHELGRDQLFPVTSSGFPSSMVGSALDPRAAPLQLSSFASVGDVLTRSDRYDTAEDRDAVNALLSDEAADLAEGAARSTYDAYRGQLGTLRRMHTTGVRSLFDPAALRAKYPQFNYAGAFHKDQCVTAAFAIEAMRKNLARCVSFIFGGFDTHTANHAQHALMQQEMFDAIATMVRLLDGIPHPTRAGKKLSDHTHFLLVSEFSRTPGINPSRGRDHHPCNSAVVISPRFRGGVSVGKSDPEQVLALPRAFSDGPRTITPADVLATVLAAHKVDPRVHLRDGAVLTEALAP